MKKIFICMILALALLYVVGLTVPERNRNLFEENEKSSNSFASKPSVLTAVGDNKEEKTAEVKLVVSALPGMNERALIVEALAKQKGQYRQIKVDNGKEFRYFFLKLETAGGYYYNIFCGDKKPMTIEETSFNSDKTKRLSSRLFTDVNLDGVVDAYESFRCHGAHVLVPYSQEELDTGSVRLEDGTVVKIRHELLDLKGNYFVNEETKEISAEDLEYIQKNYSEAFDAILTHLVEK